MKNKPEEMTLAKLDVLVMPNGEILCNGMTLGWVSEKSEISPALSDFKSAITGKPIELKEK